jgi:hypothetical protein
MLELKNIGLVELNAQEVVDICGGSFWSWLGDNLDAVGDFIVKIIKALQ